MNQACRIGLFMIAVTGLGGCAQTPFSEPPGGPATVVGANADRKVYPCVNLGVIASTPFHVWQDPCRVPYSQFRVESVQLLEKPGDVIRRAPYKPGEGFAYIERHETSSNIFLSPGFNPAALGDGDFWANYHSLKEQNQKFDADFAARQETTQEFRHDQGQVQITLIPLRSPASGSDADSIVVDHSMLVFLLGLDGVWADLRKLSNDPNNKKGLTLICKTINKMAQAHHEKWPDYKWDSKQQHVLDWCHSTAAD